MKYWVWFFCFNTNVKHSTLALANFNLKWAKLHETIHASISNDEKLAMLSSSLEVFLPTTTCMDIGEFLHTLGGNPKSFNIN